MLFRSERPWDWRQQRRQQRRQASDGDTGGAITTRPGAPGGSASAGVRLTCRMIGSFAKAQELLQQGHSYLDRNGDGVACESLR